LDPFAPFDDLAPLGEQVSGKTIVMLGEADHGAAEIRTAKLRLAAYLYYEQGFTVFTEEVGRAQANLVDAYLETGDEANLDALDFRSLRDFRNTTETFDFFRGLRRIVTERPAGLDRLRYRGFDIDFGRVNARDQVLAYLGRAATPELAATLTPLVGCTRPEAACETDLTTALAAFATEEAALVAGGSQAEYDENQDVLQGLWDTVHLYILYAAGDWSADEFREQTMMRRMDGYIAQYGSGIVVSAHDFHIARDDGEQPLGYDTMGSHVYATAGAANVYGIAITYFQGRHLAVDPATYTFFDEDVSAESNPTSMEFRLHEAGLPLYFLDFGVDDATDPGCTWIDTRIPTMLNGFFPLARVTPSRHWSGILFVDTVTPTTPEF
jgi:erythromycin esterase-like protein